MKTKFAAFILLITIMISIESLCQTLSNLTVMQRKRVEGNADKLLAPLPPALASSFVAPAFIAAPGTQDTRATDELTLWQSAARFARDQKTEFAKLIELNSRFGDLITISRNSSEVRLQVLAYTRLALQQQAIITQYFEDNRITDPAIQTAIQNEIQAIKSTINSLTSPTITVFATGNARSIATNKTPDPTNSGTGSLGASYAGSKNALSVQFTVASTIDTSSGGFGSLLLAPLNGRTLRSAVIEWYPNISSNDASVNDSWAHIYGNFSSSLWEIEKNIDYRNASILGVGILYHRRFFEGNVAETEIGLSGEIGLASRWLSGDVRNLLQDDTGTQKFLNVFPTEKNFFLGIESGVTLNFGQLIGGLQAYYFFKKKNEPVDGLTGLQISVGISVRGDIFRGFLYDRR